MLLYTSKPFYSDTTGENLGMRSVASSWVICDYSGEKFCFTEHPQPLYTVSIYFNHGSEPDWESIEIKELKKYYLKEGGKNWEDDNYTIRHSLFEGEFHFATNGRNDNLGPLMKEWVESRLKKDKKSIYYKADHFADVLRISRYELLLDLLKEGKVTLKELGLINE